MNDYLFNDLILFISRGDFSPRKQWFLVRFDVWLLLFVLLWL